MATISQEKDLDMLRKNKDGTYTKYNPKTKAKNVITANGQTVETGLADMATLKDRNTNVKYKLVVIDGEPFLEVVSI